MKRGNSEKVSLFKSFFTGLTKVYGSYDPISGKAFQVKKPVTDQVILSHLKGVQPFGVYLLVKDRTKAIAVDFDDEDGNPPLEFVSRAKHYRIPAYIERSKSKGFHAWIFFEEGGVKAQKARLVVKSILDELDYPDIEVFPKQDFLNGDRSYGNFINAPLFGRLVLQGRTAFLDPDDYLRPYPDQWELLDRIERVSEDTLDDIIEINQLRGHKVDYSTSPNGQKSNSAAFGLPPCAQKMLIDGVTSYQRVSCFRLAVHLKRIGFPFDIAVAALKVWALKNQPQDNKGVISEKEILMQTSSAFMKDYRGYGCEDTAIKPYCQKECPLRTKRQNKFHRLNDYDDVNRRI